MRHLNSLLLSLAVAPAIWVLTGYGLEQRGANQAVLAPAALAAAGILFAVLITVRLSPIGPALAGSAYLAAVGWMAAEPEQLRNTVLDLFPATDPAVIRPAEGIAALLGVPLLATLFSPRRWRRYEGLSALYAGAEDRPVSVHPMSDRAAEPEHLIQSDPVQSGYSMAPSPWTQAALPSPWTQSAYRGHQQFPPAGAGTRETRPGWLADQTDDLTEQLRPLRPTPPGETYRP